MANEDKDALIKAEVDLWYVKDHKGTANTVPARAIHKALDYYPADDMPDKLEIIGYVQNQEENIFMSVFIETIDVPDWISKNTDSKGKIDGRK